MIRVLTCVVLALGVACAGFTAEKPAAKSIELPGDNAMAELKRGPGVEATRANCVACHSTDYIVCQPRGDAKWWGGEVKKMIVVYGAPIPDADAKVIVEYLASAYGPPNKPPYPAQQKR